MATSARLPRSVRPAVALLASACATVLLVLPGTAAHASPSPAQIEAQINALWNQSELAIEQYNAVHAKLQANKAKLAQLKKQMDPLQLQVQLAYTQVGAMSAELYMRGPGSTANALLTAGSPANLADELTTLDQLARVQQAAITNVQAKVAQYAAQRKPLDALVNQLAQQDADLAAKKKSITSQLARLQKLREEAYGASGGSGGSLKPEPCPVVYVGGSAGKAVAYACAQIGKSYEWAADGPSTFDCSGLTMRAWGAAGVSLPHNAAEQYSQVTHISSSQVRTGDLVFFGSPIHHVGIYIGNGWMVHAPHQGDHVREAKVADFGETPKYGRP